MHVIDAHTDAVRRVLAERAALLARQQEQGEQQRGEELVVFRLGEGRYAIAARCVREVHPLRAWTRLPGVPPSIVGLANVRSQLLSVVDIRPLLDMAQTPPLPGAVALVLHADGGELALLADLVEDVRHSDGELLALVSQQTGRAVAWIRGIDHARTIVLDAIGLARDPRLVVDADRSA
ncbi:MAG TPA: chemotaxis protein CheW [Herpetosiphonaceae bacterium]|nr:chemotaxis protein CheW [Herpetosiphonaceae bacterium]